MKSKKKNRKSDTGAENVTSLTQGPGLSLWGSSMPIFTPLSRLLYFQISFHPLPRRDRSVGEMLLAGKSISEKSVVMVRVKSLTCRTFSPKSYHHWSIPWEL